MQRALVSIATVVVSIFLMAHLLGSFERYMLSGQTKIAGTYTTVSGATAPSNDSNARMLN